LGRWPRSTWLLRIGIQYCVYRVQQTEKDKWCTLCTPLIQCPSHRKENKSEVVERRLNITGGAPNRIEELDEFYSITWEIQLVLKTL